MNGKSFKKFIIAMLVLSMITTSQMSTSFMVDAEDDVSVEATVDGDDDSVQEEEYEADAVDEDFVARDEQTLFNSMTTIAENDNFILKYNDDEEADEDLLALQNKSNGFIWWSSPVNAMGDVNATNTLRQELKSALTFTYGKPADRTTSNQRSAKNGTSSYETIDNGIKITFKFKKAGITIPVEYTLEDDYLKVVVNTADIVEDNPSDTEGQILTSMTLLGSFGAVSQDDCDGYFVIPDGSGALINFNNGKTSAKSYSGKVYGSDVAMVSTTASAYTQQVNFPMYGIVRDDGNGIMAVAVQGDANATIKSSVSIQSKSSYNICNFEFTLRSTDTYYMGSDTTPLTVFEKNGIKMDTIEVRYYPLADDNLDYTDIAECYRNYLLSDGGVTQKETENSSNMYVDLYGGVEKLTPVCGIPITLKTSITSFDDAQTILSQLKDNGTDNMVVSYHNWTNAGIKNQVDYKATPSNTLGGSSDFKSLKKFLDENGILLYPVVENDTFVSGQGYYTFQNTNIRVSGSYSRIISYDLAFGEQDSDKDSYSLLSPTVFNEIYSKLAKNYSSAKLSGVSIGDMTSLLYGDYGKQSLCREDTQNIVTESLSNIQSTVGSVLGIGANEYTLPYLDHITDVPLYSSGYDVFDADIPFYQLVMHGVIPLATTPINASADSDTLLLQAIATGMNPRYDMIYEETSTLKDTEYDTLYYANYEYWVDTASKQYLFAKDILDAVSGSYITSYKQVDDIIFTEYANGTKTEVNIEDMSVKLNGVEYKYSDYVTIEGGMSDEEE
ncbi:MAG: DUF5696 domain-containing protein [Ruminococcus sp.]|nr:DUF5696 domain-containing protein [Ruminococcus sp.]